MSEVTKEIRFLTGLADECERSGTEFCKGRATGIRESIQWLTRAFAAERAKFAAFAGPDGEPLHVVRVVNISKHPSDAIDRITDTLWPGHIVLITEQAATSALDAAKEQR